MKITPQPQRRPPQLAVRAKPYYKAKEPIRCKLYIQWIYEGYYDHLE